MFREKPRYIPLISSFFFLVCVELTFDAKLILLPKRSTYIVYMDSSLMPKAFTSHNYWYSSIIDSFKSANLESPYRNPSSPSLLYTYVNAFHGFSAVLSLHELETLNKSLGFISAYADTTSKLATTYSLEFLSLKASTGLWPASNYRKDVIIGVLDTGIWPEHPSFKDDGIVENLNLMTMEYKNK